MISTKRAAARVEKQRVEADAQYTKRQELDAAFLVEKKRLRDVVEEKTARLKALRLAKEAADKNPAKMTTPPANRD